MKYTRKTSILLAVLALLLTITSGLAAFEYNNLVSLQSKINQTDKATVDRDTLITRLDIALKMANSRLNLKLPSQSTFLTTLPDQNGEQQATKIYLNSTAAGYHFSPSLQFQTSLFNVSIIPTWSQAVIELTENRSIMLSRWGWTFDAQGLSEGRYEYGLWSGDPVLIIATTIRNDYTSADLGEAVGNRTGNYVSSLNLTVRLYGQNGSVIEASVPQQALKVSRLPLGGIPFLLGTGQTEQVIFYLSPSSLDIDHYEIYVSSLSAY